MATDLSPALPTLAAALGAGAGTAQLSLSVLIVSFGIAQLAWGPVSDRFGRRPVLLAGLAPYSAAAIGAGAAPDVGWLIAWRGVQGPGPGGDGDLCPVDDPRPVRAARGARVMSRALGDLGGVLAMASPMLGGVLVEPGTGARRWVRWRCSDWRRWPSRQCLSRDAAAPRPRATRPRQSPRPGAASAAIRPSSRGARCCAPRGRPVRTAVVVVVRLHRVVRHRTRGLPVRCSRAARCPTSRARCCAAGCWRAMATRPARSPSAACSPGGRRAAGRGCLLRRADGGGRDAGADGCIRRRARHQSTLRHRRRDERVSRDAGSAAALSASR